MPQLTRRIILGHQPTVQEHFDFGVLILADEHSDQSDQSAHITTAADEQFWRRVRQSWHRLGDVRAGPPQPPPAPAPTRHDVRELEDALDQMRVREAQLRLQNQQLNEMLGELRADRQRYRDLFEYAPDAYVVTDHAGIISAANRAATRLFVQPSDRLMGDSLENYLPGATQFIREHSARDTRDVEAAPPAWEATLHTHGGSDVCVGVRLANAGATSADVRWLIRTSETH